MSKSFGIHGSTTSHGGTVISTQSRSSQMGNLFLRAGDGFACPKCNTWSTLIKSNDHVIFDGKAVAYVGDKFTCGATLLPKQDQVVGDSGSVSYHSISSTFRPESFQQNLIDSKTMYGQKFLLLDELTAEPLANACYDIYKSGQLFLHGKTDENGYTDAVTSEKEEEVEIIIHIEDGEDHEYCCKR